MVGSQLKLLDLSSAAPENSSILEGRSTFVQIKISARHGHLGEGTQQFIREKAEKLLHIFQRLTMIEVTVDFKEDDTLVEFLVSAEHKHDFVASERNKDVLAAVDLVMHKLEQQVRKYKEKIQDHRRTPSTGKAGPAPEPVDEE
jgi:putative sigma-54 modulation protein